MGTILGRLAACWPGRGSRSARPGGLRGTQQGSGFMAFVQREGGQPGTWARSHTTRGLIPRWFQRTDGWGTERSRAAACPFVCGAGPNTWATMR